MDDFEKRVLKKKRQELTHHLLVDDKYVYLLRRQEALDIEGAVALLDLKSNAARISKLIDIMCKRSTPNLFNTFCDSLINFDLTWLAKEMKTDLLGFRGSNHIDDDVKLEAATLVHSKFGSSKRMSECDKKQIQSMVAIKIQMAKEEWREEVEYLRKQLIEYKLEYYTREEKMQDIITRTKTYLSENQSSLVTMRHDMVSTTETLRFAPDDGDIISSFRPILETFFHRVIRIVKERDLFYSERQAIVKLVGLSEDENSIVDAVRCAVSSHEMRSSTVVDSSMESERHLAESRKRVDVLEARLLKQSDKLRSLTVELKTRCEPKIRDGEYLTKGARCRLKNKKRSEDCLAASTSNINKMSLASKTKSSFPTVAKDGGCSPRTPKEGRKLSTESN